LRRSFVEERPGKFAVIGFDLFHEKEEKKGGVFLGGEEKKGGGA